MQSQIPLEVIGLLFLMIMPLLALTLNGWVRLQSLSVCWSMVIGKLKLGLQKLEDNVIIANEQIGDLLSKHIMEKGLSEKSWQRK